MPSDEFFSSLFAASEVAASAATTAGEASLILPASVGVPAGFTAAAAVPSAFSWGALLNGISSGASLLKGLAGYKSGSTNAAYLDAAAQQALAAGAANKDVADARGRAQLAELRAQTGAQGTTMSGSPMLVYLDSVKNAAIESQNQYYEGTLKSASYKNQAEIAKKGGTASLWEGIVGAAPGAISLGSRLLTA